MAHLKVFAHRMMLGVCVLGFGLLASGAAYQAAGAAMSLGSMVYVR